APLASSTGDVGLMQVNRITWRSLYDLKGLKRRFSCNGNADAEILHYYLTRYAIPKKRTRTENGNLARATYSAYSRSWRARTPSRRATDSGSEKSRPRILGQISNRKLGQRACGQRLLHQLNIVTAS